MLRLLLKKIVLGFIMYIDESYVIVNNIIINMNLKYKKLYTLLKKFCMYFSTKSNIL